MFIIRDMVFGNLLGEPFANNGRFAWHGDNGWCEMSPADGLQLVSNTLVLQQVYEIVELPSTGSGPLDSVGDPEYNEETDKVERTHTLSSPPPSVPSLVTSLQARLALTESQLRDTVETWVNSQPQDIQDYWHYSATIHRDHAIVSTAMVDLNITSEQMDNLFIFANTL